MCADILRARVGMRKVARISNDLKGQYSCDTRPQAEASQRLSTFVCMLQLLPERCPASHRCQCVYIYRARAAAKASLTPGAQVAVDCRYCTGYM